MKKAIYFLGIIVFVFLFSCNKDNQYSCNEEINDWVTTYKNDNVNLSREQLAMIPIGYQKALLGSFSKEKKAEIWKQKLVLVKEQFFGQQLEIKVDELINFIKPENFRNSVFEKPDDNILNFINEWEHEILSNNMIDSTTYFINFCTIMTLPEIERLKFSPQSINYSWLKGGDKLIIDSPIGGGGGSNECTCLYDIYCSMWFNMECVDNQNNCIPVWNCGPVGQNKCNGQCEENITPG